MLTVAYLVRRRKIPAASVPVSPNPVRTKAVAALSSPSPKPVEQRKFSRKWVWPLLLIAAAGLLGAGIVWPQGFVATDVRQPTGGVYLMYKPTRRATPQRTGATTPRCSARSTSP